MTRSAFTDLGATHVQMDTHRHGATCSENPRRAAGKLRCLGHVNDDDPIHIMGAYRGEQSADIARELLAARSRIVVGRIRLLGYLQLATFQPQADDRLLRMEAEQLRKRSPDLGGRGQLRSLRSGN